MTWKEYEIEIHNYFKIRHPSALIKRNIKIPGRLSGTPREIDILIETEIFGHAMQIVIECKNWSTKLDVADIGAFIDKLRDVGVSKGILISKLGYSEAAYSRARTEIDVQLQVLDFENLPNYYGFWGNPYRGNVGAIISAPNGWVVDAKVPADRLIDMLCYIHPFEYSVSEAKRKKQWMYFQIYRQHLSEELEQQDKVVKESDPDAIIEYWSETIPSGKVTYRKIKYSKYELTEFTAGVQADDFFAYCVCELPRDYLPDDLARLRFVMRSLYLIKMPNIDPLNPHEGWKKLLAKK